MTAPGLVGGASDIWLLIFGIIIFLLVTDNDQFLRFIVPRATISLIGFTAESPADVWSRYVGSTSPHPQTANSAKPGRRANVNPRSAKPSLGVAVNVV